MIWTSNFGRVRLILSRGLVPVSTARYAPDFYIGRVYMPLAPSKANFHLTGDAFDAAYLAQLAALDPQKVVDGLGENAVLLCWEADAKDCHRSLIARWLKDTLGLDVPELK